MNTTVGLAVLKSDQNGIEIPSFLVLEGVVEDGELKSDQNGIEIPLHVNHLLGYWQVKIRPKWDWNIA